MSLEGEGGGKDEGWRKGREGRGLGRGGEGRDDCYTYSNIIQWHHSI